MIFSQYSAVSINQILSGMRVLLPDSGITVSDSFYQFMIVAWHMFLVPFGVITSLVLSQNLQFMCLVHFNTPEEPQGQFCTTEYGSSFFGWLKIFFCGASICGSIASICWLCVYLNKGHVVKFMAHLWGILVFGVFQGMGFLYVNVFEWYMQLMGTLVTFLVLIRLLERLRAAKKEQRKLEFLMVGSTRTELEAIAKNFDVLSMLEEQLANEDIQL